jgi:hypothetical protein
LYRGLADNSLLVPHSAKRLPVISEMLEMTTSILNYSSHANRFESCRRPPRFWARSAGGLRQSVVLCFHLRQGHVASPRFLLSVVPCVFDLSCGHQPDEGVCDTARLNDLSDRARCRCPTHMTSISLTKYGRDQGFRPICVDMRLPCAVHVCCACMWAQGPTVE